MILCDSSNPGQDGGVYHRPYVEGVEGYLHAYATKYNGIQWTRNADHPPDEKCPECSEANDPKWRDLT